jgi:hypothetical protein
MINLDSMSLRELQLESARVLSSISATNNNISKFNKQAHHNSQNWYKSVIQWYIDTHGDLPSKVGPGKDIKLIQDV